MCAAFTAIADNPGRVAVEQRQLRRHMVADVFPVPVSRAMTQVIFTDSVVRPRRTTNDAMAAWVGSDQGRSFGPDVGEFTAGERQRGSAFEK